MSLGPEEACIASATISTNEITNPSFECQLRGGAVLCSFVDWLFGSWLVAWLMSLSQVS